jgi:hypothetical protein
LVPPRRAGGQPLHPIFCRLRFLVDGKISFLKLFTPCPYPGTKYHEGMSKVGRILDGNWARYDYGSPLIRPTGMTTDEMLDGFKYVYEGFYSVRNIVRRFTPPPPGQLMESSRTSSPISR